MTQSGRSMRIRRMMSLIFPAVSFDDASDVFADRDDTLPHDGHLTRATPSMRLPYLVSLDWQSGHLGPLLLDRARRSFAIADGALSRLFRSSSSGRMAKSGSPSERPSMSIAHMKNPSRPLGGRRGRISLNNQYQGPPNALLVA